MEGLPFEGKTGEWLRKALLIVVVVLGVFLAAQAISTIQSWRYIGAGVQPTNTINVTGYGEAFGAPDIAQFSFTVSSEKATVADAQKDATQKINDITAYLKSAGIDDKDVQTSDYSISPQYDYTTTACVVGIPCPGGKQTLRGYEVRQTTTVKVRDTSKAGDLLTGVGSKGATEVSGLDFTFDDPNKLQNDARAKAIADAKQKADLLASQLGVHLVRVVSFNDNSASPMPYMAKSLAYGMGGAATDAAATAPSISIGQNKVTSNVSITYEIQ